MATLELRAVGKRYPNGTRALAPISLAIGSGEFVAVLGSSGAGKSTLIRTINGLETATEGKIVVDGTTLNRATVRAVRARVGMVFQQFNLVGRLSVMTNVLTGRLSQRSSLASLLHLFRQEDVDAAHAVLARVGLVDLAWRRADQLSGGQQQRVGIARALAQSPRLILADEPVASLDPVTAIEIMDLLREINRRDGITVLVSLHQVDLVRRYADRIIGLNAGRVVFDGPPDRLDATVVGRIYGRTESAAATVAHALHDA